MNALSNQIKLDNLENMKVISKRIVKIYGRLIQLVAPYILIGGITSGALNFAGLGRPFHLDDIKHINCISKEIDEDGNIHTKEQYKSFDNDLDILDYHGKWELNSEGIYQRNVQRYSLEDVTEENINKLLNREVSISEVLGIPKLNIIETSNNVLPEDLTKTDFLTVTLYDEELDDYIFIKEPIYVDIINSAVYVISIGFICNEFRKLRKKKSKFDFKESVKKINENYPLIDTFVLTKKLQIKKANYNRLTR